MKTIKEYIKEGLLSRKISTKTPIRYNPKDKFELIDIIVSLLEQGITDLNCIDVSNIDDLGYIFNGIIDANDDITVKDIDISEWNVSNVTDMQGMFWGCEEFNADLSNWDVSNVTNMAGMFKRCEKFNSDLSNWNVSNVTYMYDMFSGCELFNSDLSHWNVSKVTDMGSMFSGCYEFNADLSKWDVPNRCKTYRMFKWCDKLREHNKLPDWYKNNE